MRANFYPFRDSEHPDAVAEAEIVFGDDGPLTGIKMRCFRIGRDGSVDFSYKLYVSEPSIDTVERGVLIGLAVFPAIRRRVFAWLLGEYKRAMQSGAGE